MNDAFLKQRDEILKRKRELDELVKEFMKDFFLLEKEMHSCVGDADKISNILSPNRRQILEEKIDFIETFISLKIINKKLLRAQEILENFRILYSRAMLLKLDQESKASQTKITQINTYHNEGEMFIGHNNIDNSKRDINMIIDSENINTGNVNTDSGDFKIG